MYKYSSVKLRVSAYNCVQKNCGATQSRVTVSSASTRAEQQLREASSPTASSTSNKTSHSSKSNLSS